MTQPSEAPRCQVEEVWEVTTVGSDSVQQRRTVCGEPLVPTEGPCVTCGHQRAEHGQEREFYECGDSRREVCLLCPGYVMADEVTSGYPNGKAWHRYRQPAACPVHGAAPDRGEA